VTTKTTMVRTGASFSLALAMLGCPPADDGPNDPPPADQECELDLNFDTTGAEPLVDGTATGILCPAFDQDLFAFEVEAPGTIATIGLSMATALTRVNPAYRIVRDDGSPEGAPTPFSGQDPDKSAGEATDFTAAHRIDEPGVYYVLVFDQQFVEDTFDIANPYTLTVALAPDPDPNEANNTPATATPLTAGTAITGQIATTGDEDWYAVAVPAGAKILDLTFESAVDGGVEHEVQVIAADGQTAITAGLAVENGPVAGAESLRLRSRVDGGATAYVRVKARNGQDATLAPEAAYTFTASIIDNPDANEGATGNDSAATATRVTSGATVQAVLASTADQDVYRIAPGARSRENPGVLIVGVEIDGVDVRTFRPQVQVLSVDPEEDANGQRCGAGCGVCDQDVCKEVRLQRFVPGGGYRTAFPLRDARDVLVIVNEFGDDAFQEGAGYTITFEVITDPDADEGDDVLIPNLEFAGFANEDDLRRQFQQSKARARVLTTTYPADLPLVPVPSPIDGVPEAFTQTVDCSAPGAGPQTVVASGRLTYEGDRDYFRVDVPAEGYWALDFDYQLTGASTTPVELTLFVRADNGLIANTLEATQTQGNCLDTIDCPAGSICVDGACWSERDDNATFASRPFPDPDTDECAFVSVVNRNQRPLYLEVVDNGINDFDVDVAYRFELTIRCGCPAACNRGAGNCQGVLPPQ
jgi:hypothetical protein